MSVTHSLPKAITEDAFASIFVPRTRGQKASDIISTLSRTVEELEQPMSKLGLGGQHEMEGDSMHKIDFKHPDGTESSVYVQLNAMSGQFLPFRPPPLPEVEGTNAEAAAETGVEDVVDEAAPHHRVYKAVFTIEETTDTDGQIKVMAHSPQLIEEQAEPRSFLERMAQRQLRFEEGRESRHQDTMLALSVLRRRKLRMKKKKYKKLLKRTRNERRKLDRN
ncbi:putative duf1713 domain-containing protein [Phaeoacremonium minimum UCRPA7]|uniref:Small ribosomal subunit protein mS38 n=1 Tax=Phaeoacremonium minimum (strain UCR-PA7) TaxID=1286976 RepID=R8BN13_PHAM7|nr:putative duf1713 domain-containing protein [Phaeoacremonium minimum UCRPA7]EOO00783.1 putative duf1713 domain-containing protein [Phaeoacremonium minimum UCRPA7]